MLKRLERSYQLALLILAGAALLAACGDNTSTATSAATTAAATTAASTTAAVTTAATTAIATTAAANTTSAARATTVASSTTAAAGAATLSADAEAGRQIVAKNCSVCHLQNGTAAGGQGPNLSTSRETTNANLIQTKVRKGDGAMPPFSQQQISDADLAKIVAYLQAIHK